MNESQPSAGLSCLTKAIIAMVAVPLMLLIAIAAWWFGRQAIARGEVDRRVSELRSEGMPVDDDSLEIYYVQNTDGTLAAEWVLLCQAVDSRDFQSTTIDVPVFSDRADPVPLPPTDWPDQDRAGDFLTTHRDIIDDLDRLAAEIDSVRFPIQFSGMMTLLPEVQQTRGLSRLMLLRHYHALHIGDAEDAAQAVITSLGIARSLQRQPFLVSHLVRNACHEVALMQLRDGLQVGLYTSNQLQRIHSALDSFQPDVVALKSAFIGERAAVLSNIDELQAQSGVPGALINVPNSTLVCLDVFQELIKRCDDGEEASLEAIWKHVNEMETESQPQGWLETADRMFASMAMPSISSTIRSFLQTVTSSDLARLAIAVHQFHDANGRWPATLDEVHERQPDTKQLQPIGGKPFGYAVNQDGITLWAFPEGGSVSVPAMTETPDTPPVDPKIDNPYWIYRVARPNADYLAPSPKAIENP